MQPRLCPGQPSGVVVGLLIHPAPGKHPETARPLAPCSEETETRRYLTAALARPMANPTGYKAALAGVSPRPPRHVSPPPPPPQPRPRPARWDHLSPGWSPLDCGLDSLNGGLCSLVTTHGPGFLYPKLKSGYSEKLQRRPGVRTVRGLSPVLRS